MKKTISLAMAAALAVSGAVTTVPVFADDVTNITIWSPTDRESIEAWWKERISEWNEEHPEIQAGTASAPSTPSALASTACAGIPSCREPISRITCSSASMPSVTSI